MKFCQHCGAEVHDEAVVCVKCGCSIQPTNNVQTPVVDNSVSTGLVILAFFIPLFGIIYWPVKAKTRPNCARACGMIALASWIINIFVILVMTQMGAY